MRIISALRTMMAQQASDVHLTVGTPPAIRVHGRLAVLADEPPCQAEELEQELEVLLDARQLDLFRKTLELDFALDLQDIGRFRGNIARERGQVSISMRAIKVMELDINALGLPDICRSLADKQIGLVVLTGPTGSGKSTTLAAMIEYINHTSRRRLITLEDPIEYMFSNKNCVITQREVGEDTYSFEAGLIHALRQDPDVIMVGEMRDAATVETALRAAETGHLVLSTAHAPGAPESVERIVDLFPSFQHSQVRSQLAAVLQGIIYQKLLPNINNNGRVPGLEVMLGNYAVKNLIREGKGHQLYSTMQMSGGVGMQTMDQHLLELVQKGVITKEIATENCQRPEEFEKELRGVAGPAVGANGNGFKSPSGSQNPGGFQNSGGNQSPGGLQSSGLPRRELGAEPTSAFHR